MPSLEKGPAISSQLAKIIDGKFATEFDLSKRKKILDKYPPPENCASLFLPKVNPQIWSKLNTNAKRTDIRMSSLQDSLVKATSAVSVAINDLLSAREQKTIPVYKDLIAKLIDSVVLIGHVSSELTFKRRDSLRPYLTNDFKQGCSRSVKPGNYLFGDDLPETLKQVRATSRIVSSATNPATQNLSAQRGYRPRPSFNGQNQYGAASSSQQSFLGYRGRLPYNPRRNNQQPNFQKKKFTKN